MLLTVALLVCGCSILNPHLDVVPQSDLTTDVHVGSADAAIREARRLSDDYYAAVGTQSVVRNGTALVLIPLSAAALGIGVTAPAGQATRNTLTAMGLGGAALYTGSSFVTDRPRELIWLKGSEALNCAVDLMRPLIKTAPELATLKSQITTLANAIVDVLSASIPRDPVLTVTLDRAERVLAAARSLVASTEISGMILHSRVLSIRDRVSEQISHDAPDLSAILTAAGGLRIIATAIAPGGVPTASQASRFTSARSLPTGLEALNALNRATETLASVLADVASVERAARDQDVCMPADVAAQPRLVTAIDTVTLAPGQMTVLAITAGSGIPRVVIEGLNGDQLTTALDATGGAFALRIAAAPDAAPGDRTLVLSDQGGREAVKATIRVVGQATPATPEGASGQARPPPQARAAGCEVTAGELKRENFTNCQDFETFARLYKTNAQTPTDPAFLAALIAHNPEHKPIMTKAMRDACDPNRIPLPGTAPAPAPPQLDASGNPVKPANPTALAPPVPPCD